MPGVVCPVIAVAVVTPGILMTLMLIIHLLSLMPVICCVLCIHHPFSFNVLIRPRYPVS
jgi:hypothetical protein